MTPVHSGTGTPEPVFTDTRWSKLTAAQSRPQGGGSTYHLYGPDPEHLASQASRRKAIAGIIS